MKAIADNTRQPPIPRCLFRSLCVCYVGETRHGLSSRLLYGITLAKHNKSVLDSPMFGEIRYTSRFAGNLHKMAACMWESETQVPTSTSLMQPLDHVLNLVYSSNLHRHPKESNSKVQLVCKHGLLKGKPL